MSPNNFMNLRTVPTIRIAERSRQDLPQNAKLIGLLTQRKHHRASVNWLCNFQLANRLVSEVQIPAAVLGGEADSLGLFSQVRKRLGRPGARMQRGALP